MRVDILILSAVTGVSEKQVSSFFEQNLIITDVVPDDLEKVTKENEMKITYLLNQIKFIEELQDIGLSADETKK